MRWLLAKDLQILRRSPLITALLVAYPVLIAVLIGFALSRSPDQPRVALLDQTADQTLELEGESLDLGDAEQELCERIECVPVDSREEARERVESGDVLGALIVPEDFVEGLRSLRGLNPEQVSVTVLVTEEDPVSAQLVEDRIRSLLAEANLLVWQRISEVGASYLEVLIEGGELGILGQGIEILGLTSTQRILEAVARQLPPGSDLLPPLVRVIGFASLARANVDIAQPLLSAVAEPISVRKEVVGGDAPSLDAFAISAAATFTLMFVTVLLVAGSLAQEREENAFARLARGLVGRGALLVEKVLLGIAASLPVTLLMLAVLTPFVAIHWDRAPQIVAAIVAGAAAFAAFGAAIGAAAGEVRASSLLAFMISLPVAFLSLVPSGSVSPALFDAITAIAAAFPFDAALDALSGGLDTAGPALGGPLVHLAVLAIVYGALARLALRRLAD